MKLKNNENVKETLELFLKFGTVFLVYRITNYVFIEDKNKKLWDKETIEVVLLLFLGFALYINLIKDNVDVKTKYQVVNNIINDTLLFGTALITQHTAEYAYGGGSGPIFNKDWSKNAAMVLASFALYRVSIDLFVTKEKTVKGDLTRDLAQFGSFLVFYRILQGGNFNESWVMSVMTVLLGFTVYHGGVRRIIDLNK